MASCDIDLVCLGLLNYVHVCTDAEVRGDTLPDLHAIISDGFKD